MLKKIVIILADGEQREAAYRMREKTGKTKEVIVCESAQCIGPFTGDSRDTLFVTDSQETAQELFDRNCPVTALIHDNNKGEGFERIPYALADIEEQTWESFERAYLRLTGQPWTILETKRCVIRETTVEDVETLYRIYAEPSITYYMENLFLEPEEEREYTRNYIEKVYGFYGYGMWSIVNKENGEVIGRAGLSWREGFEIPELGFLTAVPYQRKGYAYEVCRAVLEYGREELEFESIQALIKRENKASIGLCEKLGFTYRDRVENDGEWYDRYIYTSH